MAFERTKAYLLVVLDIHTWMSIHAREDKMQVAKWGNSLAVRLPADLVWELGLKEGDQVDLVKDEGTILVRRQPRADEVLQGLRRFRGKLPEDTRLCRDTVHER